MKKHPRILPKFLAFLFVICTLLGCTGFALGTYALQNDFYSVPAITIQREVLRTLMLSDAQSLYDQIAEGLPEWRQSETTISNNIGKICQYDSSLYYRVMLREKKVYSNKPENSEGLLLTRTCDPYVQGVDRIRVTAYLYLPLTAGSIYHSAYYLIDLLHTLRYAVWLIGAVCTAIAVFCAIQLLSGAGRRKDTDEIVCSNLVRQTPLLVLLIFFAPLFVSSVLLCDYFSDWYLFYTFSTKNFYMGLSVALCSLLTVWLAYLLVLKTRTHTLWHTHFMQQIAAVFSSIGHRIAMMWSSTRLWWRAGLVLVILAILDLLMLCLAAQSPYAYLYLILMLIEKIILCFVGIMAAINFQKLQEGAVRIKNGGTKEKLNTDEMFWEFKKQAETLNSIGDGIQKAVDEQLKSERFQTELITNVSHDIKTPMTSIINYVDLLSRLDLPDETAKEYIQVLTRQSARLKKLIEDLVEASKAQSGCLTPNLTRLDFALTLDQACGEYADRFGAAQLTAVLRRPEHPIMMMADGKMLWRILDNLFSNIVKYSMPGTRVFIEMSENGELCLKNISRDELNIPGEELAKRFVRGDASRGQTSGSGLGLSIAISLTELMGGKLSIVVDGDLFKTNLSFPVEPVQTAAESSIPAEILP